MSDAVIDVTVSQGGIIDADLAGATVIDTVVEQGGLLEAAVTGGGTGPKGDPGEDGVGVPTAGTTGQVLRKVSNTNFDDEWHTLAKADVGLSNVDNTSDANKPVSTAQATAIGVVQADIDAHEANTSNPHSVTKSQVGLGNVDNTADTAKPVSTATQTALDAKLDDSQLDTDGALAANSDSKIATQKATKTYVDSHSSGASDADATTKGILKLTNDLAGTAALPQVVATHLSSALPVNQGGTAATSASAARTSLGLAIGSDVEAYDADLNTIAGLSPSNDDIIQRKSGAWANRTLAQLKSDLLTPIIDVRDYGAQAGSSSFDNAPYIQAAINAAALQFAVTGTVTRVFIPAGRWYSTGLGIKSGVYLFGAGFSTELYLFGGSSNDLIGSYDYQNSAYTDPYHFVITDMRLHGNKAVTSTTGRLLALYNSTYGGILDNYRPGSAMPGQVNDPSPIIKNLRLDNSGNTTEAVYLGTNFRGAWVDKVFIRLCNGKAMTVQGTDMQLSNIQAGACADGISVTGQANMFSNCKSWYHSAGTAPVGRGNGFTVEGNPILGTQLMGNQFTGCQSQDNNNYGIAIIDRDGSRFSGFVSGGDTAGVAYITNADDNHIDAHMTWGDRSPFTTGFGLTIDGTACTGNTFLYSDTPAWRTPTTYRHFQLLNSATTANNSLEWRHKNSISVADTSNNLTPDCSQYDYFKMTLSANATINDTSFAFQGQKITFQILQDATGGRTLTWAAAYKGVPPVNPTANALTEYTFVQSAVGSSNVWRCVAAQNIGPLAKPVSVTANTTEAAGTPADIASITFTPYGQSTLNDRPIEIMFTADNMSNNSGTNGMLVDIYDVTAAAVVGRCIGSSVTNGATMPCVARAIIQPGTLTVGTSYTFKARLTRITGGTATVGAAATRPAWLTVRELP